MRIKVLRSAASAAILSAAACGAALAAGPAAQADAAAESRQSTHYSLELKSGKVIGFKSEYSGLDLEECDVVAQSAKDEPGPGWAHWRCAGLTPDWPVHVLAGDLRYAVSYGENAPEERAAAQFFSRFTRLNDTLEWVLERGRKKGKRKPIATILRFFLHVEAGEREDGRAYDHPVLVVTQLKPGAVCHTAYIDARANQNANKDARGAALGLALNPFDCKNEPKLVGPQTPGLLRE